MLLFKRRIQTFAIDADYNVITYHSIRRSTTRELAFLNRYVQLPRICILVFSLKRFLKLNKKNTDDGNAFDEVEKNIYQAFFKNTYHIHPGSSKPSSTDFKKKKNKERKHKKRRNIKVIFWNNWRVFKNFSSAMHFVNLGNARWNTKKHRLPITFPMFLRFVFLSFGSRYKLIYWCTHAWCF